jgi:hypothetical protein
MVKVVSEPAELAHFTRYRNGEGLPSLVASRSSLLLRLTDTEPPTHGRVAFFFGERILLRRPRLPESILEVIDHHVQ